MPGPSAAWRVRLCRRRRPPGEQLGAGQRHRRRQPAGAGAGRCGARASSPSPSSPATCQRPPLHRGGQHSEQRSDRNLPDWAVVEVPAMAGADGIRGVQVGAMPRGIAALLTLSPRAGPGGRGGGPRLGELALQALLADPVSPTPRRPSVAWTNCWPPTPPICPSSTGRSVARPTAVASRSWRMACPFRRRFAC
jgi:hypothetical protein